MPGTKKQDHYIVFPKDDHGISFYDMLRYDACYPVSNAPDGYHVLVQPYRGGRGGFTLERWATFGIRTVFTCAGPTLGSIPGEIYRWAEAHRAAHPNHQPAVSLILPDVARALGVLVLTPHIRTYLETFDPKALEQAFRALNVPSGDPTAIQAALPRN